MSAPSEHAVTAVLRTLWHARGEVPMQSLQRESALEQPSLHAALATLESRGCRLQRSPSGVQLTCTPLTCWQDILEDEARRHQRVVGRRVMVFNQINSTNDVALHHAGDPEAHGLAVLADDQTAGRGRLGHAWVARGGQSVLLSVVLRHTGADAMNRLALLAGLAASEAVELALGNAGQPGRRVAIKWPNDLLVDGGKIGGILLERAAAGSAVVVGVGINVMQARQDFPEDLQSRATSMALVGAPQADRLAIISPLLDRLNHYCADPYKVDEAHWLEQWKGRCDLLGTRITIRSSGHLKTGYVLDVNPLQGLILKDETGVVHFFSALMSSLS